MMKGFQINISNTIDSKVFFADGYDSFVVKDETVEITVEGIILNKTQLLQQNNYSDFSVLFEKFYKEKKIASINELDGEFRGYVWDKLDNKLFVFTNPTSTQRVFYTQQNRQIFIDSHLVRLSKSLKENKISVTPDIDNLYKLLTFGNMLENETPIDNVFKILDGHYLEIDLKTQIILEKKYFDLENVTYFKHSKNKAIQDLDAIFSQNIIMEYGKDNELDSKHFTLLSGGLDSRMGLLYAEKLGYKPDEAFCFSQSGYLDETISRTIAKDYQIPYKFQSLDGGDYLKYIDRLTELSEGCGLFTGGIHVQYAFENLQNKDFKIVHSGSIGDGILGGFNTVPFRQKPGEFKIVVNQKFLTKVKSDFEKVLNHYESEELFYLRNVAYNRTVLGAQVIEQYAYQTSPFMSKTMLEFAISLPEKWKINQKLYLEWLNQLTPNASDYIWEKTGMKPNAQWKSTFGPKVKKRISKIWNSKIRKQINKISMYPYEFYYYNSQDIQDYYQTYFKENIWRLEDYPELRQDVEFLFEQKDFYQKSQGVNILAIFKLFFK
ncbi:hypothetical protein [Chryseobacterium sp. FH1]|uniref:hypothetical protein n=1 Tax=Chryseobacterium sp. FH1 TaxID=1233951 RepID=UPI0004E399C3|nr:hypothetical protein [Chryseobacterium sp. FH1]KFC24489.1 hypothetical protein IO90_04130 [Chryseobacterium sp. FH1]